MAMWLQIRGLKNENDAKWIVQGLHSVKGVLHAAVSIETKVALVWVSAHVPAAPPCLNLMASAAVFSLAISGSTSWAA